MHLTRNFTLDELCASSTAKSRNIPNVPDVGAVKNLRYLAVSVLQPIRDHFSEPIVINSGYRSPQLNRAIGGSASSFHSIGCAADIQFASSSSRKLIDLFLYIHDNLQYTELIAEELPRGWVHVAIQQGREDEKQLKYKKTGEPVRRGSYEEILAMFGG